MQYKILLIILSISFFSNCTSISPSGIIVCSFHEVSTTNIGQDTYGKEEVPAIKIMGYGGETVNYDIVDIKTGILIDEGTQIIPKDKDFYLPIVNLSPGSYQARLMVQGILVDTYTFHSGGVGSYEQSSSSTNQSEYYKVDTSSDWFIDENLIIGDIISDETKSIYSSIIQDESITIKSGSDDREQYINELKKIDFKQSPDEFKKIYLKHIDAWIRNDSKIIESTWGEIGRIALKYGIRKK